MQQQLEPATRQQSAAQKSAVVSTTTAGTKFDSIKSVAEGLFEQQAAKTSSLAAQQQNIQQLQSLSVSVAEIGAQLDEHRAELEATMQVQRKAAAVQQQQLKELDGLQNDAEAARMRAHAAHDSLERLVDFTRQNVTNYFDNADENGETFFDKLQILADSTGGLSVDQVLLVTQRVKDAVDQMRALDEEAIRTLHMYDQNAHRRILTGLLDAQIGEVTDCESGMRRTLHVYEAAARFGADGSVRDLSSELMESIDSIDEHYQHVELSAATPGFVPITAEDVYADPSILASIACRFRTAQQRLLDVTLTPADLEARLSRAAQSDDGRVTVDLSWLSAKKLPFDVDQVEASLCENRDREQHIADHEQRIAEYEAAKTADDAVAKERREETDAVLDEIADLTAQRDSLIAEEEAHRENIEQKQQQTTALEEETLKQHEQVKAALAETAALQAEAEATLSEAATILQEAETFSAQTTEIREKTAADHADFEVQLATLEANDEEQRSEQEAAVQCIHDAHDKNEERVSALTNIRAAYEDGTLARLVAESTAAPPPPAAPEVELTNEPAPTPSNAAPTRTKKGKKAKAHSKKECLEPTTTKEGAPDNAADATSNGTSALTHLWEGAVSEKARNSAELRVKSETTRHERTTNLQVQCITREHCSNATRYEREQAGCQRRLTEASERLNKFVAEMDEL